MKYRYKFIALFVLIIACLFLFYSFYQHAKKDAIDDLNMRQMIFAKQAVTGIEEYFNHWITLLTATAESDSIVNLDGRGKEQMDFILRSHGQGVRAISRLDQDGRILHTIPFDAKVIGSDLSGQKHVREIMRTHKPVLSGVFTLVQGYRAVALHVPVFMGDKYRGTIAVSFDFAVISKTFMEEIVIGKTGYAWMVDEEGIELFCPVPGHTGNSVFDNCRDFPTILSMAKEMLQGKQGITTYLFDRIGDQKPEPIRKHAVYLPARVANTFWSIVVATSEEEVLASLQGFRNRLIGIIAVLFLGSLLFSYYAMKAWGIVREEGERRSAEQALREKEERYRDLYEEAPVGYHELDTEGRIVRVNRRELQMLGYSADEMVGAYAWDFAAERETSARATQEKLTGISPPSKGMERTYRRKDGTTLTLAIDEVLLKDAEGRITGIRSALSDITERKRAEEALRASEIKYRELHQSMMDAFVSVDLEGRIIDCNDAYQEMLGYPLEELRSLTYQDITPEKWHVFEDAIVKGQTLINGYSDIYEKEYRRKDGTIFPVELRTTLLRDNAGAPFSMWAIVRDITGRKQAEAERLRLAAAIDQSGEIVVMTDKEGIIQYVNPAFERITGYAREESVGKNPRLLKSGKQGIGFYKELWGTLTAGRTWKGRFVNKKRDGVLFEEDATISPIRNLSGEITHYVAVKHDVTEQLKTEKQLFQAQKMEAIGTMAGGIAHDFNNILGAISGYTEISLAKIPSDSRIKYYLEQIQASSQRAINLVRQILEFSRLTEQERTPVCLIPLVKETIKMLREIIPSTIEIRLNIRTDADAVLGDATQLYQILMNLCTNAYQAMKDRGGLLAVDLVRIEVGEDDLHDKVRGLNPGAYVELIVRDTGTGIDPIIRERIFDPFFTTKKIGEGTGLGLSVVHGIVKSYNGKITVESRVGEGSAFCVYLPLLLEKPEASPREPEGPDMDGRGRILLVDDETMLANVTKELLEDRGYTVIAKTDSVDALETFRADPDQFDLVITDQTMPMMTGIDLAKKITTTRADMPVILCTGFIDAVIEEKTITAGVRAVVLKPVSMKRLIPLIRNLLAPGS